MECAKTVDVNARVVFLVSIAQISMNVQSTLVIMEVVKMRSMVIIVIVNLVILELAVIQISMNVQLTLVIMEDVKIRSMVIIAIVNLVILELTVTQISMNVQPTLVFMEVVKMRSMVIIVIVHLVILEHTVIQRTIVPLQKLKGFVYFTEIHHMMEFCRFTAVEDGTPFARVR